MVRSIYNFFMTVLGLLLLGGFFYGVYYVSNVGTLSRDEPELMRIVEVGRSLADIEAELGNPNESFIASERKDFDAWLKQYPALEKFVDTQTGMRNWNNVSVYTYKSGYAEAMILTYGVPTTVNRGGSVIYRQPLQNFAILVRDSGTVRSNIQRAAPAAVPEATPESQP